MVKKVFNIMDLSRGVGQMYRYNKKDKVADDFPYTATGALMAGWHS